jgi:hypothetical protein
LPVPGHTNAPPAVVVWTVVFGGVAVVTACVVDFTVVLVPDVGDAVNNTDGANLYNRRIKNRAQFSIAHRFAYS